MIDPQSLGVSGFEQVKFAYPENEYDEDVCSTYDEMPEIIDRLVNKLKRVGKKVIQAFKTNRNTAVKSRFWMLFTK